MLIHCELNRFTNGRLSLSIFLDSTFILISYFWKMALLLRPNLKGIACRKKILNKSKDNLWKSANGKILERNASIPYYFARSYRVLSILWPHMRVFVQKFWTKVRLERILLQKFSMATDGPSLNHRCPKMRAMESQWILMRPIVMGPL